MKSHWISHKDKRILYCDYTNFGISDFEALKAELFFVESLMLLEPQESILSITDIRGSVAHTEAINEFKNSALKTRKYVKKQAVVGVSGLKKILFDAVVQFSGQNARVCEDLEQAKTWLLVDNDL